MRGVRTGRRSTSGTSWADLRVPLAAAILVAGLAGILGGSLSAGAAPARPPGQEEAEQLTDLESGGRTIYLQDCAWCHGSQGEGSVYGPSLRGVGAASADFMLRTGRMPVGEPVQDPAAAPPVYTEGEIDAISAYVATFGDGPPVPEVEPGAGDLASGATVYEENCAACHSSTGIGGAITSGEVAPHLDESTATEIGEAVRIGGAGLRTGDMPRFDERTLPDDDLDSVALYILSVIQGPPDVGGLPLDHLGPVAEGFVAVFLALPLLILLIRWIGEKTH